MYCSLIDVLAGRVVVDVHVLAIELNGLNSNSSNTFMHSLLLACLVPYSDCCSIHLESRNTVFIVVNCICTILELVSKIGHQEHKGYLVICQVTFRVT